MSNEIRIIWSEFAERQLDSIFSYYHEKVGKKIAKKLIQNIIKEPDRLIEDPFIGQEESLLKGRKNLYRYLIHKNYKIIYSVDEEMAAIKIADVFDTRQNPVKMNRVK